MLFELKTIKKTKSTYFYNNVLFTQLKLASNLFCDYDLYKYKS